MVLAGLVLLEFLEALIHLYFLVVLRVLKVRVALQVLLHQFHPHFLGCLVSQPVLALLSVLAVLMIQAGLHYLLVQ